MRSKNIGVTAVTYFTMLLEGGLNNVVGALMVLLALRLAREPGDIALLASMRGIGTVITLYICGLLSDKKGRKGVIIIGGILFVVFIIGMMTTSNYFLALFYSFIGGLAFGFMDAPSINILFDVYREKSGPYVSFTQVFFGSGGMFTSFLAAVLISRDMSYNYLFAFYLIISLITITLAFILKFPTRASEEKTDKSISLEIFENPPNLKKEGIFILIFVLFYSISSFILMTWLPLYIQITKGIIPEDAVQSLTYYLLGTVIGSFVFSIVLRRTHATQLLGINSFLAMGCLFVLIITTNLRIVYIFSFFIGFFLGNFFPMIVGLGGEFFPSQSGGFTGMVGTASTLGGTIIVSITGLIVNKIGVEPVMWISFGALAVVVILSRIFRKMYLGFGKKVFQV